MSIPLKGENIMNQINANPNIKFAANCNDMVRRKVAVVTTPICTLKTLIHSLAKNNEYQTAPVANETAVAAANHHQLIVSNA